MKQWTLGKPEIHRFLKIQTRGRRTLQRWKTMVDDKKVARNEDVSMDSHKLYIYTHIYIIYTYLYIHIYLYIYLHVHPSINKHGSLWKLTKMNENDPFGSTV